MKANQEPIVAVPTNIITGFLGVGKTSVITHLLKQKPDNERWAVLVNEFGEIGIDGSLLVKDAHKENNVFIKEVPGGCMCCASGLPMQIALNQLLTESRPHRLLIEPTGLGHPLEVLNLLSNQYYRETLSLEKTLTLVDARKLSDKRYTEHETFNQQLEIADIIVGNKMDLYGEQDETLLKHYIGSDRFTPEALYFTEHGAVELTWMSGKSKAKTEEPHHHHHHHHEHNVDREDITDRLIPDTGFLKAVNQGEGYHSVGWRIASNYLINRHQLKDFLNTIEASRVKGVFITSEGCFGYNNTQDGLNEVALKACTESRLEIICDTVDESWEESLKQIAQRQ